MKNMFLNIFEGIALIYVGILQMSKPFVNYIPIYWYIGLFFMIISSILCFCFQNNFKKIDIPLVKKDKRIFKTPLWGYIFINFSMIFYILVIILKSKN